MKNEKATTYTRKQSGRDVEIQRGKKAESAHCKLYFMREFLEIVKPFIKF